MRARRADGGGRRVAAHAADELRGVLWGSWVNGLLAGAAFPRPVRAALLRATGIRTRAWNISPGCFFGGRHVAIGRGTFIGVGCMFDSFGPITIGEEVAVAMHVLFVTSSHEPGTARHRAGRLTSAPIAIGDGCWIGARVTILSGVTVGEGCVIAAGSVVTRDCAPHGLYAGVPAERRRDLPR